MKVFLDAGHGGKDPGALGNGLKEKDINLSVALKIGDILKNHGVNVGYSRTTDVFVELQDRAIMANNFGADVFVSIHTNAAENINAKGVETFSYPGSVKGSRLAQAIQDSVLDDKLYTINRGTKTANYAVLRLTNMPAALVELAFITNPQDADILRNRQDDLAVAVAKGILHYLGIQYVEKKTEKQGEKELDTIKINLHGKELEVEGFKQNNTNYIPVRFLENMGYQIDWDNDSKTVLIDYKEG